MPPAIPTPQRFLSRGAYKAAADRLGCDVEAIIAISVVEGASRGAFDEEGFPTLLYERHLFRRYTGRKFDAIAPDLSNRIPSYKDHSYGRFSEQKVKLARARKLDNDAALEACSWGLYQCLGRNARMVGAPSLQAFVNGMCSGVDYHLRCFVGYFLTSPKACADLRAHRWVPVAEFYNGKDQAATHWAEKIGQAFEQATERARTG